VTIHLHQTCGYTNSGGVAERFGAELRQDPTSRLLACDQITLVRMKLYILFVIRLQLSNMSVLLETSAGDITIDLLVKDAPKCCEK
jgi:hypothetical protein